MKIVVIGTRGIPNILGGVETHCEELFPRIALKEFDITIVRRKNYTNDTLNSFKGVNLIDISAPKRKSLEAIIHTFKALWLAKYTLRANVVHIHAIGPAILTPLARLLGMKVIFTHHGLDYNRAKWGFLAKAMLKFGERMGCMFANEVIVISDVINDNIKKKYGRNNAHLIYNGVPLPTIVTNTDYLNLLGLESRKFIFAMGRFVPEKNFHKLINSFSLVKNSIFKLVLAGDTDFEDDYSRKLKELAKNESVILTGFIKGEKLYSLLSHAHTFVLPSSHEGLPISLLEAMSYGLPVIASNIPANLEVQLPHEDYFMLEHEEDLQNKIKLAINKESQRIIYSMSAYNWDTIAEQTIRIYEKIK